MLSFDMKRSTMLSCSDVLSEFTIIFYPKILFFFQVYNTAISDPNCLNHYEPFTPEVGFKIFVISWIVSK
jgi:hypothetical protein